ncbi:MAG: hypothetical protein ABI471_07630 [Sphingomonas bacterium]
MRYMITMMAALGLMAGPAGATKTKPTPIPAPTATAAAPAPAPSSPIGYPQALILIRTSLAAVQQANETNDYDVLFRLGAQGFQSANPPARLAQLFAPLRPYNLNAAMVLEPKFIEAPHLLPDQKLAMKGVFDVQDKHIVFSMIFTPEAGHWRLFGIGVQVR